MNSRAISSQLLGLEVPGSWGEQPVIADVLIVEVMTESHVSWAIPLAQDELLERSHYAICNLAAGGRSEGINRFAGVDNRANAHHVVLGTAS